MYQIYGFLSLLWNHFYRIVLKEVGKCNKCNLEICFILNLKTWLIIVIFLITKGFLWVLISDIDIHFGLSLSCHIALVCSLLKLGLIQKCIDFEFVEM